MVIALAEKRASATRQGMPLVAIWLPTSNADLLLSRRLRNEAQPELGFPKLSVGRDTLPESNPLPAAI